jgi:hypothetical protein
MRTLKLIFVFLVLSGSHIASVVLRAQPFAIDWFTIDGGAGASSGGAFTLSGTIGQPDAGSSTGGDFSLLGGFWAGAIAIQTPGAPFLSVSNSIAGIVIYWTRPATGFVLDETASLSSWSQTPWPYQTNATHVFITATPPATRSTACDILDADFELALEATRPFRDVSPE